MTVLPFQLSPAGLQDQSLLPGQPLCSGSNRVVDLILLDPSSGHPPQPPEQEDGEGRGCSASLREQGWSLQITPAVSEMPGAAPQTPGEKVGLSGLQRRLGCQDCVLCCGRAASPQLPHSFPSLERRYGQGTSVALKEK